MPVKHSDNEPSQPVSAGEHTSLQVLWKGPNFAMRKFVIEPGGGMPLHTNTVEHEQYVLSGQAHIVIGNEEHDVHAGDAVFIPAGVPHRYKNTGVGNFEFLCMIPNEEDVIELLKKEC